MAFQDRCERENVYQLLGRLLRGGGEVLWQQLKDEGFADAFFIALQTPAWVEIRTLHPPEGGCRWMVRITTDGMAAHALWVPTGAQADDRTALAAERSQPATGRKIVGQGVDAVDQMPQAPVPAGGVVAPADVLPAMLSASDLAKRIGQPSARVETFLRRFRATNRDCAVEVDNPRKNSAKYLYRTKDVWPALQAQLPKWAELTGR